MIENINGASLSRIEQWPEVSRAPTRSKVNYCWRLIATGLCFSVFGLGVFLIGGLIVPLTIIFSRSRSGMTTRVQRVIELGCKGFVGMMERLRLMDLEISGLESLKNCNGGCLFVANHPTLIDVLIILAIAPRLQCVTKQALWDSFFLRQIIRAANYVPSLSSLEFVTECAERLRAGHSLLIFPEGTRSLPGRTRKFQRGAAAIAIKSGAPIVRIAISCIPSALTKGLKWYQIPPRRSLITLRFFKPLVISGVLDNSWNEFISSRKLTEYLEDFYRSKVVHDPHGETRSRAERFHHQDFSA